MAKAPARNPPENDVPPGFMPDGTSMIVPDGEEIKWPEQKIVLADGTEVSQEEYEAMPIDDDGVDYSFMNDLNLGDEDGDDE